MEYCGIVYGPEPESSFYKLTTDDIEKIRPKLVGIPVRVEHLNNTLVGYITKSNVLEDGRLMVSYKLNADAAGYTADQLIADGHMTELSMTHIDDGYQKTPTEVSIVFKGARPDTKIVRRCAPYKPSMQTPVTMGSEKSDGLSANVIPAACRAEVSHEYINNTLPSSKVVEASAHFHSKSEIVAMSAAEAKEEVMVPAGANAMETEAPMPVEPVASAGEQPSLKRARTEDANEAAPADAALATEGANSAEATRLQILEALVSKLPDNDSKKQLYDLTSDMMETLVNTQTMSREQANRIKALEEIQKTNEKSVESNARATANIFGELFSLFMPNYQKNEQASDEFVRALQASPKAMEFLRPVEVCASAIKQQNQDIKNKSMHDELVASREKVKALQSQIGAYNRMGGAPMQVQQPPAPVAPTPAPAPTQQPLWTPAPAAPLVQVAASAHGAQPMQAPAPQASQGVQLPSILRDNMNSYSKSSLTAQRVMPSDFAGPLAQKRTT